MGKYVKYVRKEIFPTNEEFIGSVRLDGEVWKDVVGFEGKYMVSSLGRVISLSFPIEAGKLHYVRRPHFLNITNDTNGYQSVGLRTSKNMQRRIKIHRLVAMAFIPNPNNYTYINHKDENKKNNMVDNLEWCTQIYNVNYGSCIIRSRNTRVANLCCCKKVAKLDENKKIIATYPGLRYAAEDVNRDYSAITFAIKRNGKCAGYYWMFL